MNPEIQMALNILLHESIVEGIDVDTDGLQAVCTVELTAEPSLGSTPANPCSLLLGGITRVRVALVNPDGTTPLRGMKPIPLDSLNSVIRQFMHPQQGFDFIDSSRDDVTGGRPMVDWEVNETVAPHTLTFSYGVRSAQGRPGILLVRLWFDQIDVRAADGSSVELGAYMAADFAARSGMPFVVVPGTAQGLNPMPAPIPAELADGASIALVFVDAKTKWTKSRAVGKGVWTGTVLKWLSPSRTLYDLPDGKQSDILPALAEWSEPGDPMGGVKFWTTVEIARDDPINPRALVEKYLKPTPATPRVDS